MANWKLGDSNPVTVPRITFDLLADLFRVELEYEHYVDLACAAEGKEEEDGYWNHCESCLDDRRIILSELDNDPRMIELRKLFP